MDDAYSAYFTFENASDGKVTVCCCNLHARRKFVKAFEVRKLDGMTNEQIEELPDFKVIRMYGEIYHIETTLKELTPEVRLERRQNEVKPVVDRMFKYVDSLDPETPTYSNYLSEAISYMQRHKEDLNFIGDDGTFSPPKYRRRDLVADVTTDLKAGTG